MCRLLDGSERFHPDPHGGGRSVLPRPLIAIFAFLVPAHERAMRRVIGQPVGIGSLEIRERLCSRFVGGARAKGLESRVEELALQLLDLPVLHDTLAQRCRDRSRAVIRSKSSWVKSGRMPGSVAIVVGSIAMALSRLYGLQSPPVSLIGRICTTESPCRAVQEISSLSASVSPTPKSFAPRTAKTGARTPAILFSGFSSSTLRVLQGGPCRDNRELAWLSRGASEDAS